MSVITDGLLGGKPHPRVYGTFPRILGKYVREEGVLSLEDAIRKMTSNTAQKLRLRKKGLIAENYDADITIFDPKTVKDNSTMKDGGLPSTGIPYVVVNGIVVVKDSKVLKGVYPGKAIRRAQK